MTNKKLRIVYAGTPDVSAKPLEHLFNTQKYDICAVITNPASAQKRGKTLVKTPVAQTAERIFAINQIDEKNVAQNVPIFTPAKLSEIEPFIKDLNADVLVCFAYGKIFKESFLNLFAHGGINLHPSLLPKYRGCAPVPAAILNGDSETGITIQRMAKNMDAGNILLQEHIALNGTETAETLLQDVAKRGGALFEAVLDALQNGTVQEVAQNHAQATYFGMIKKEDGAINWNDSAKNICAKIRAFCPWPGAFTTVNGVPLIIHNATVLQCDLPNLPSANNNACAVAGTVLCMDKKQGILIQTADGILCVQTLQWQTKKAMNYKDFLNGSRNFIGSVCK